MLGMPPSLLYLLALLCLPLLTIGQWEHSNSEALHNFVTRPDLKAPKWNLTIYHPELVSPGYWFVSPYRSPRNLEDADDSWVGPHIYDGNGELVWSGTEMFSNGKDTMSFQLHNVRGEELMTTLDWSRGEGVIFDNHYEIRETVDIYGNNRTNAHEFHFVEDGEKALAIKTRYETSTEQEAEAAGLHNGKPCHAHWDGIVEYDTDTWEVSWEWNSKGHISLNESTFAEVPIEKRCDASHLGWDFIHCNSVDKTADGDYLLSCRHSNTIYKISHLDGSVLWRFGGFMSDFDQGDLDFSRQHNIRIREENSTHTIVSFLDNAKGQDSSPPSHDFSRGLLVALDEKNMKSTLLRAINHPDLDYASRRGNYQELPNGNVFMGWSKKALHSEHSPDGTLLMQARMLAGWLGSYRNYKFPFVGKPLSLPTVHSAAYGIEGREAARTVIHVSWNGATEVDRWRFFKTIGNGKVKELLGMVARSGFETMLEVEGYSSFVIAQGHDKMGAALGTSAVFKTIPHPNMTATAVEIEGLWLLEANSRAEVLWDVDDDEDVPHTHVDEATFSESTADAKNDNLLTSIMQSQFAAFIVGFVSCGTIGIVVWLAWRRGVIERLKGIPYDRLDNDSIETIDGIPKGDELDENDTMVDDIESQKLLRSGEKSNDPPDKLVV